MKTKGAIKGMLSGVGTIVGLAGNGFVPNGLVYDIGEAIVALGLIATDFYLDHEAGDFLGGVGLGLLVGEILETMNVKV